MKVFVIGAGQVGTTIVEALHEDHELTVLDTEQSRLRAVAERYDVVTYEGDGTSRKDLASAGVGTADLIIACTSRDEVNLVAGMFARREATAATTVIRTSNVEYVELWRAGELDVDFVVSSELETAHAISRIIGVPAARQTDVFADGQVQIVEFDAEDGASADVIDIPLRDAKTPSGLEGRRDHSGHRDDPARRRRLDTNRRSSRRDRVPASREGLELSALARRRDGSRRRHLRCRSRRLRDRPAVARARESASG